MKPLEETGSHQPEVPAQTDGRFATTHWSVVLAAGDLHSPQSAGALETLCRTYWYPLYAFVRRQGHSAPDAQDLTQEFFARLLRKNFAGIAQPERGKFRWFLLSSLRHFLANEWDRAKAQKRGGGRPPLPLDEAIAENRYGQELSQELTAERLYDRRWALTLLEQVHDRLREEFAATGHARRFQLLEQLLPGEKCESSYGQVASQLGIAEGTVKYEIHRFKRRFRELLRAEIAHTVSSPSEIDEEMHHLIEVIGG
jgi:RNA polymerase sigma-70 factor (ECF subfamily)